MFVSRSWPRRALAWAEPTTTPIAHPSPNQRRQVPDHKPTTIPTTTPKLKPARETFFMTSPSALLLQPRKAELADGCAEYPHPSPVYYLPAALAFPAGG